MFVSKRGNAGRPRSRRTLATEENILEAIHQDGTRSSRSVASELGIPCHSTVLATLHENNLKPFHFCKVQPLYENDNVARMAFCTTMQNRIQDEPNFVQKILWTDECTFTRDGVFNSHNMHTWAEENPRQCIEFGHQRKFSVNVWVGLIGAHIIGPFFLEPRLNANGYLELLEEMEENLPLALITRLIYMHDGAPPHTAIRARNWLDAHFPNRWIGRYGPIAWPPRSPDLNPLDFFLWGFIKDKVYQTPPINTEDVRERIRAAVQLITPDMLQNVINSIPQRIELCLQTHGFQFEHLRR